ncbi:hypothetical protein JKP88DRAFT_351774 [Tribonema minus]|uniref:HEAT repeat-containing protein 1 n=1 Tax=Tribonema minus TaxID=303371 RepID=A0A835ZGF5_9STRA|nr:hypothetical protein JKP88DRAFT_351774 [Tribonema minus]
MQHNGGSGRRRQNRSHLYRNSSRSTPRSSRPGVGNRTVILLVFVVLGILGMLVHMGILTGWKLVASHILLDGGKGSLYHSQQAQPTDGDQQPIEGGQGGLPMTTSDNPMARPRQENPQQQQQQQQEQGGEQSPGGDQSQQQQQQQQQQAPPGMKSLTPRTFEMLTADISDLRKTVVALKEEMEGIRKSPPAQANSNIAALAKPAFEELSGRYQKLQQDMMSTKEMLMATAEALVAGRGRGAGAVAEQKRLLIVSEPRSGSTQFGELFNSNEQLFYLFEPCKGGGDGGTALYDEACGYLLQRLLECEPTVKDVDNMFRDRQSAGVVVKEIRTVGVHVDMLPRATKVMHLVRDPRDAMLSALALWRGQDGGLEFQSGEFCRRTMAKITSTDALPEGQRMVIKLEQLAADVFTTMTKMHRWAELGPINPDVQKAIRSLEGDDEFSRVGAYVKGLTGAEQGEVTAACTEPMAHLGYSAAAADEAADVDLETVREGAVSGLNHLAQVDDRFAVFEDTLLSKAALSTPRELQTLEDNKALDKQLAALLRLLSPHFLQRHCHLVLEYLIRHYSIYHHNVDAVVSCILPWHDSKVFVRMVQLLNLTQDGGRWAFLTAVAKTGIPLPREALARQASHDMALLEFICKLARRASGDFCRVHTFFAMVTTEAMQLRRAVSESMVRALLPTLLRGASAVAAPQHQAACYMVIGQLASHAPLSPELCAALLKALCTPGSCASGLEQPLLCALTVVQGQTALAAFPLGAFRELVRVTEFSAAATLADVLCDLSGSYDALRLLRLLLGRFLECVMGEHEELVDSAMEALMALVRQAHPQWPAPSFPALVAWLVEAVLEGFQERAAEARESDRDSTTGSRGKAQRNAAADRAAALSSRCSTVLAALAQRYPEPVDAALQRFLAAHDGVTDDTKEVVALAQTAFAANGLDLHAPLQLLSREGRGSGGGSGGSAQQQHAPLLLALDHPSAALRAQAVAALCSLPLADGSSSAQKLACDVRGALLRRIADDDVSVVAALAGAAALVAAVATCEDGAADGVVEAAAATLRKLARGIATGRALPSVAAAVAAVRALVGVVAAAHNAAAATGQLGQSAANAAAAAVLELFPPAKAAHKRAERGIRDAADAALQAAATMDLPLFAPLRKRAAKLRLTAGGSGDGDAQQEEGGGKAQQVMSLGQARKGAVKAVAQGVLKMVTSTSHGAEELDAQVLRQLEDLCAACGPAGRVFIIKALAQATTTTTAAPSASPPIGMNGHTNGTMEHSDSDSDDAVSSSTQATLAAFTAHVIMRFSSSSSSSSAAPERLLQVLCQVLQYLPMPAGYKSLSLVYSDHCRSSGGSSGSSAAPADVLRFLLACSAAAVTPEAQAQAHSALLTLLRHQYYMRPVPALVALGSGAHHDSAQSDAVAAAGLQSAASFLEAAAAGGAGVVAVAACDITAALPQVLSVLGSPYKVVRSAALAWLSAAAKVCSAAATAAAGSTAATGRRKSHTSAAHVNGISAAISPDLSAHYPASATAAAAAAALINPSAEALAQLCAFLASSAADIAADPTCVERCLAAALLSNVDGSDGGALAEAAANALPSPEARASLLKYVLSHTAVGGCADPLPAAATLRLLRAVPALAKWPHAAVLLRHATGASADDVGSSSSGDSDAARAPLLRALMAVIAQPLEGNGDGDDDDDAQQAVVMDEMVGALVEALGRVGGTAHAAALEVLMPEWCAREALTTAHRARLVIALLAADHLGGSSAHLSTALKTVSLPPRATACILDAIVSTITAGTGAAAAPARSKGKKATKAALPLSQELAAQLAGDLVAACTKAAVLNDGSGKSAAVAAVCVVADFVALTAAQHSGSDAALAQSLFSTLAALQESAASDDTPAAAAAAAPASVGAAVDYCMMTVFGALAAVRSASPSTSAADPGDNAPAAFTAAHTTLVAQLLQRGLSVQTHNAGLLLLAQMAEACPPGAVAASLDAIVSVLSDGAVAAPDSYAFTLARQVIERVLPALTRRHDPDSSSVASPQAVASTFAAPQLFGRVRPECRAPLFGSLLKALGWEVLPCVVTALLAWGLANPTEGGEEEDEGAVSVVDFLHKLCAESGAEEQVRAMTEVVSVAHSLVLEAVTHDETGEATALESLDQARQALACFTSHGHAPTNDMEVDDDGAGGSDTAGAAGFDAQLVLSQTGADAQQLVHALLTFVKQRLAAGELHVLIVARAHSDGDDDQQRLQREFLMLCEALLLSLRSLTACHAAQASREGRRNWAVLQRLAHDVFGALQELLSVPSFVAVVMELLQSEDSHLRLKGLQMLTKRLEHTATTTKHQGDMRLFLDLIPDLRTLACAAALPTKQGASKATENGASHASGGGLAELTAEAAVISETALLALHVLAQALAATERKPFVAVLSDMSALAVAAAAALSPEPPPDQQQHGKKRKPRSSSSSSGGAAAPATVAVLSLASTTFMCLATLVSLLKARAFPKFPEFFPAMLSVLEWSLSAQAGSNGTVDEQRARAVVLLQQSILSSAAAVAAALPQFLHAHVERLLSLALNAALLRSSATRPYVDKVLAALAASGMEPRLLLPAAFRAYAPAQHPAAICRLHQFIGDTAAQLGRENVLAYLDQLTGYFLGAMDYRRLASAAEGAVEEEAIRAVDAALNKAVLAVLLKLNERELRQLFLHVCRWKDMPFDDAEDSGGDAAAALRRQKLDRLITFYALLTAISGAFKSIVAPYFSHVLSDAKAILEDTEGTADATASGAKTHKKKRQKAADGDAGAGAPLAEEEAVRQLALRHHVVAALTNCFQYDRNGFVDQARFELILPALLDQIDAPLLLSQHRSGAHDHATFVDSLLAPCIAHLAFASGKDTLWKPLVNGVLLKMRSSAAVVRVAALAVIERCFRVVGEEFLGLLPECLPFFSEAMEDASPEVEGAARRLVKYIEDVLGESVESYLS